MSDAREKHVERAARTLADPRIQQFWDPANALGAAYQKVLKTPEEAWDVYLLFRPEAYWDGRAPAPDFWMHQLSGMNSGRRLNGDELRTETEKLLADGLVPAAP